MNQHIIFTIDVTSGIRSACRQQYTDTRFYIIMSKKLNNRKLYIIKLHSNKLWRLIVAVKVQMFKVSLLSIGVMFRFHPGYQLLITIAYIQFFVVRAYGNAAEREKTGKNNNFPSLHNSWFRVNGHKVQTSYETA